MVAGAVVPEADPALEPLDEPPTFSVVVPVYQGAHMVTEALESLLAQRVAPHEIIVCDDGSTDDLAGAVAPYGGQVTLLRQEHKGVAAARNLGTFHASGEFVVVCDADDIQLPRLIEAFGELAMARPDLDILSHTSHLERDGKPAGLSRTPEDPKFPVDDQRRAILFDNFVPASSAARRLRILDIGGYDETLRCASDYDVWMRLILAGARAGLLLEPVKIYRYLPGSVSSHEVWCLNGRITALTKALDQGELTPGEQAVARERLAFYRRDLQRVEAVAEAKSALLDKRPDARRRSLRVALGGGQPLRTRVKAGVAVIAPSWSARRMSG